MRAGTLVLVVFVAHLDHVSAELSRLPSPLSPLPLPQSGRKDVLVFGYICVTAKIDIGP